MTENLKVKINKLDLNSIPIEMVKLRMSEPLILADELAKEVDILVDVRGGGLTSQADAVRLAIARALNDYSKDKLKRKFLDYDRTLLVADIRKKEATKPNTSGNARAKRQKSYR